MEPRSAHPDGRILAVTDCEFLRVSRELGSGFDRLAYSTAGRDGYW